MTQFIKYPRTRHLPWSPGASEDDLINKKANQFVGQEIVVTEKMDGENTSLYPQGCHARSLHSGYHPSRSWLQGFHAQFAHLIPQGWRICGENLYARHSIEYRQLQSYFYAFAIYDQHNHCLDWPSTQAWFKRLGLCHPPVLYQGIWDEAALRQLTLDLNHQEGYVVRLARGFDYAEFSHSVAKWVRPNHVTTHEHWMHQALVVNGLEGSK